MVAPPELSRALERHEVIGLFHDAEDAAVPTDIGADAAGVYLGDVEADATVDDLGLELRQRFGQRLHFVRGALEKKEGQPLGGLGPAGPLLQGLTFFGGHSKRLLGSPGSHRMAPAEGGVSHKDVPPELFGEFLFQDTSRRRYSRTGSS